MLIYTKQKTDYGYQVTLSINGRDVSFETKLSPVESKDDAFAFAALPLYKEATSLLQEKDYSSLETFLVDKQTDTISLYEKILQVEDALTISLFNALWAEVGEAGGLNEVALEAAYKALVIRLDSKLGEELTNIFQACGFNYEV